METAAKQLCSTTHPFSIQSIWNSVLLHTPFLLLPQRSWWQPEHTWACLNTYQRSTWHASQTGEDASCELRGGHRGWLNQSFSSMQQSGNKPTTMRISLQWLGETAERHTTSVSVKKKEKRANEAAGVTSTCRNSYWFGFLTGDRWFF